MNIYLNKVIRPTIFTFLLTFITLFIIVICFSLIYTFSITGWYLIISISNVVLYSIKFTLIPSVLVAVVALIIFSIKNRNLKPL
jgi:hypothetical protein